MRDTILSRNRPRCIASTITVALITLKAAKTMALPLPSHRSMVGAKYLELFTKKLTEQEACPSCLLVGYNIVGLYTSWPRTVAGLS